MHCNLDHIPIINTYCNATLNPCFYEVPQKWYQGPEFRLFGCIVGTGECIGFFGVLVGHYSQRAYCIPVKEESTAIEVSPYQAQ